MDLFMKPHLPLISQRIAFERKTLPLRPTITHRLNLKQRIRRTERVRFSAAAPRLKELAPSRAASRSTTPALVSDTPLSDLSELSENDDNDNDSSNSIEAKSVIEAESVGSPAKIAKPPGSIGRQSGGYNLEVELKKLEWGDEKYKKMIVSAFDHVLLSMLTCHRVG